MRIKISAASVKELKAPALRWDAGLPGFGIRVHHDGPGGRVYVLRYYCRRHLKDHWVRIGPHGLPWSRDPVTGVDRTLTPDNARGEAVRILGQVAEGRCPAEERDKARRVAAAGGNTFGELARRLLAQADVAESTRKLWLYVLNKRIGSHLTPPFVERDPATITRRDVGELLDAVKRPNEVLTLVSWVYQRAIEKGLPENSPAARMGRPEKIVKRDRVSSTRSFAACGWRSRGLSGHGTTSASSSRCSPARARARCSGPRRTNVTARRRCGASRLQVRRTTGRTTSRSRIERTRSGTRSRRGAPRVRPRKTVAIPGREGPAQAAVRRMGAAAPARRRRGRRCGEAQPPEAQARRAAHEAPPTKRRPWTRRAFCFHDLRRTLRDTLTRELGVAPAVAEAVIGHATPAIVATYAPSGMVKECRKALERWERKLLAIAAAKPEARVVEGRFGL